MFRRVIDADQVKEVLKKGEIIKSYHDDEPYPSQLMLGFTDKKALHVLVAENKIANQCIVVTVYEPDPEIWENDLKTRRK